MKRHIVIALGLGFVLMAGLISPAAGENDSLHVILTVEDRDYGVGDTVTVQMRIYQSGILTDAASASDIFLSVANNHNLNNPTNVTLSNSGTGIYTGTYTVGLGDEDRNLYFFYEVTVGNDHEEITSHNDALVIPVYSAQDTVDVSVCGQDTVPARPGDVLTATVLTRRGSTLIPVSGFNDLYVEAPDGQQYNLTYTILETGVYSAEFTVPQTSVSGIYEITAQPMDMWDQDTAEIYVNVMEVWYHKLSASGNTVSFELCTADLEGTAVEGANFLIRRLNWPNDVFTGVTNASGKALVHVPDVDGATGFAGYVLAAGLNQSVSGVVYNPAAEEPHHSDFDIIWEGTEKLFEPGESVTIPYGAYNATIPYASKPIYYYVTARGTDFSLLFDDGDHVETAREVLAAGTVTTDSLGKFSLAFDAPEEQSLVEVRFEVPLSSTEFAGQDHDLDDDRYYEVFPENAWDTEGFAFWAFGGNMDGDGGVSVSGSFDLGERGEANFELSAGTGDPAAVIWGIGELTMDDMASWDPEWMSWVPAGYIIRMDETEPGKYGGTFMVPEFVGDQDITIIAGYMDSADGTPHFDAKTISPGGGFPWLLVGIAILILIIMIAIVYFVKVRA